MSIGGMIVILAALVIAAAGWGAGVYSTRQINLRRVELAKNKAAEFQQSVQDSSGYDVLRRSVFRKATSPATQDPVSPLDALLKEYASPSDYTKSFGRVTVAGLGPMGIVVAKDINSGLIIPESDLPKKSKNRISSSEDYKA